MVNVLVCNQKGGVGKSMLADELAFSFERAGTPVSFYDLDGQGGTVHGTREDPAAEVSVVDTPGALQRGLADWIAAADVIVVPARPSSRDIAPTMRMAEAVGAQGKLSRTLLVVNGWTRFRASRDFCDWLGGTPFPSFVRVPQSELVVQAGAAGRSVVDYAPRSKAAAAIAELGLRVRSMAGLPA